MRDTWPDNLDRYRRRDSDGLGRVGKAVTGEFPCVAGVYFTSCVPPARDCYWPSSLPQIGSFIRMWPFLTFRLKPQHGFVQTQALN